MQKSVLVNPMLKRIGSGELMETLNLCQIIMDIDIFKNHFELNQTISLDLAHDNNINIMGIQFLRIFWL